MSEGRDPNWGSGRDGNFSLANFPCLFLKSFRDLSHQVLLTVSTPVRGQPPSFVLCVSFSEYRFVFPVIPLLYLCQSSRVGLNVKGDYYYSIRDQEPMFARLLPSIIMGLFKLSFLHLFSHYHPAVKPGLFDLHLEV